MNQNQNVSALPLVIWKKGILVKIISSGSQLKSKLGGQILTNHDAIKTFISTKH